MKYVLRLEDTKDTSRKGRLKFNTIEEAIDHARWIILNDAVDELYELALQDDSLAWKETIERIHDLALAVRNARTDTDLEGILEEWNNLVGDNVFDTMIELISA